MCVNIADHFVFLSDKEKNILNNLKAILSQNVPLHSLILFGSRARGEADDDSDMDVAVILNNFNTEPYEKQISNCTWEAGFEHGIVVSSIVFSLDEWEKQLEPIIENIEREGILI